MIKSQLIQQLSRRYNELPEPVVAKCVNELVDSLSDALSVGQRIEVRGFGSFSLHYHPPRNAHNPKTGARVVTESKFSPHFKPGKELRERVNASKTQYNINNDEFDEEDDDNREAWG